MGRYSNAARGKRRRDEVTLVDSDATRPQTDIATVESWMIVPRVANACPPVPRLRFLPLVLSMAGPALWAAGCSGSRADDPGAAAGLEPTADAVEAERESREPTADAPAQAESLTRSLDGALPGSELPAPNQPWTGDLDGMVERRLVRALVTFSRTN